MPAEDIDLATDIRTSILAQSPKGGRAILWMVVLSALVGWFAYLILSSSNLV